MLQWQAAMAVAFWDTRDFTLLTQSYPSGSVTIDRDPAKAKYAWREAITATAVPAVGRAFVRWSGDFSGEEPIIVVSMEGITSWTLIAETEVDDGDPADWSTVVAEPVFWDTRDYRLALNVEPAGTGTITVLPKLPHYPWRSSLAVEITPATGWEFVGWQGVAPEEETAVTFTFADNVLNQQILAQMQREASGVIEFVDTTVQPVFWDTRNYSLQLTTVPAGAGTITRMPHAPHYPWRSQVQLAVSSAIGKEFLYWSGAVLSTESEVVVITEQHDPQQLQLSVSAHFRDLHTAPHDLAQMMAPAAWDTRNLILTTTVSPTNSGSLQRHPDAPHYIWGQKVRLIASPNEGHRLDHWVGDRTAYGPDFIIQMLDHQSVVAHLVLGNPPESLFAGWLLHHFGALDAVPSTATKQGRAVSLAEAFLLGDNPHDDQDVHTQTLAYAGRDAVTVHLPTLAYRNYRLWVSHDLSPNHWQAVEPVITDDGYTVVRQLPLPASGGLFVNVEILPQTTPVP